MRHEEGAEVFGSIMEYFKILMGIAKDNMIPEEQLYIHDEEMCPCGSGKIYADCCKGKCDTQPVPSVKPVEVLCATDGGSVLYVGRFYELMKVKAMTLY